MPWKVVASGWGTVGTDRRWGLGRRRGAGGAEPGTRRWGLKAVGEGKEREVREWVDWAERRRGGGLREGAEAGRDLGGGEGGLVGTVMVGGEGVESECRRLCRLSTAGQAAPGAWAVRVKPRARTNNG